MTDQQRPFIIFPGERVRIRGRRVLAPILSMVLFLLDGCQSLAPLPSIPNQPAIVYSVSMMSADRSGEGELKIRRCTPRYMDADFRWKDRKSRELSLQTAWPPGFDHNRGRTLVPLSARYTQSESDGGTHSVPIKGFVLFHDLATCHFERAVFAATSDSSVIEPKLFILDVKGFGRQAPWAPRTILFIGYRTLLNESVSIAGPVPFMNRERTTEEPAIMFNGVMQKNRALRGVSPPDLRNRLVMDLWIHGKPFHLHGEGDGENGIFVVRSKNVRGLGVLLPRVPPPYHYPGKKYRFVIGGGLLVDGPVAMQGVIDFSNDTQEYSIKAQMNQAGSILDPFRYFGRYVTGPATRFGLPGEVDMGMEFNHRPMTLILLPDPDNKTYWIGSVDQNIFGIMEPFN